MFAGNAGAYISEAPELLSLHTYIILGWKSLTSANTLAYLKNLQISKLRTKEFCNIGSCSPKTA
jgi:hypothetical protein